ncbi:hypothetical protein DPMN_083147 [Dreissena polymorpha]|uniref:Uncharacterized protein n=1 Tax=Dreissena polymorpha TaxID=45954 RepID=A0A9D3YC89_DREPO|nr:hypothetical protein DPMN_083147 [Dreissena polymorpha]
MEYRSARHACTVVVFEDLTRVLDESRYFVRSLIQLQAGNNTLAGSDAHVASGKPAP